MIAALRTIFDSPRLVPAAVVLLLFAGLSASLAAQAEGGEERSSDLQAGPGLPEETEIKLPDTLLEVEELAVEEIRAELPESPDVPIRPIDLPLPEEEELRVAGGAFALPAPATGADVPEQDDRSSYFASGILGAGSMSHIEGALSLSKLGSDPRLRFQFSHSGLDGYDFRDPGTGYFRSRTYIDGLVAGALGSFDTEGSASFLEEEQGLQGNPNFYSANLRFIELGGDTSYPVSESVELGAALEGRIANRILTIKAAQAAPPRVNELSLRPSLRSLFTLGDASISADTWYSLQGYTGGRGEMQSLGLRVAADAPVTSELFVGGNVGLYWPFGGDLRVPFGLSITATVEDLVTLELSGGYEAGPRSLFELWQEEPLLADDAGNSLPLADRRAWVGRADLSWNVLSRRLVVSGGVDVEYDETGLSPAVYDAATGVFPVSQGPRTRVKPDAALTYRAGLFTAEFSGTGSFIDPSPLEPRYELGVLADLATEDREISGSVELRTPFFPEPALPVIRGELGFRVVEGLRILLRLHDPLAPILDAGRPRYGSSVNDDYPFIAPGFRFSLSTEISL